MTNAHARSALLLLLALAPAAAACRADASAEAVATPDTVVLGPDNVTVAAVDTIRTGPTLSGSLEPEQSAEVRAQVAGTVLRIQAEQGQTVRRGQVLARIEDTALEETLLSARAALRTAEHSLSLAQRNAARTDALAEAGAIAARDVEQAEQNVTASEGAVADARARLRSAQEQVERATVRAPIGGVIAEQPVSAGDVVQVGNLVYTIVDPRSMRLEASVPVEQLAQVQVGTPVQFRVAGYDAPFAGKISRVSPAVDAATKQVHLYAAISGADRPLVAGLFAEGEVATEQRLGLVVPDDVVNIRGIRPTALRVRKGVVERVEVELGAVMPDRNLVEVVRGLAAGDTLVRGNAQGAPVGAPVTVTRRPVRDTAPTPAVGE
jgi:membrane fusion protein, multidrug efflux system